MISQTSNRTTGTSWLTTAKAGTSNTLQNAASVSAGTATTTAPAYGSTSVEKFTAGPAPADTTKPDAFRSLPAANPFGPSPYRPTSSLPPTSIASQASYTGSASTQPGGSTQSGAPGGSTVIDGAMQGWYQLTGRSVGQPVGDGILLQPGFIGQPVGAPIQLRTPYISQPTAPSAQQAPGFVGQPVGNPIKFEPGFTGQPVGPPVPFAPGFQGQPVGSPVILDPGASGRPVGTPAPSNPDFTAQPVGGSAPLDPSAGVPGTAVTGAARASAAKDMVALMDEAGAKYSHDRTDFDDLKLADCSKFVQLALERAGQGDLFGRAGAQTGMMRDKISEISGPDPYRKSSPKAGDIMMWDDGNGGGHVAIVSNVDPKTNTITFAQMGNSGANEYTWTLDNIQGSADRWKEKGWANGNFLGFWTPPATA